MPNVSRGERSNKVGKLSSPASDLPPGKIKEVEVLRKMRIQESERTFQDSPVSFSFGENDHSLGEREVLIHETATPIHPAAGDQVAQVVCEVLLGRRRPRAILTAFL